MARFELTRHPDHPIGWVNGDRATYFASITEATPPFALAGVVCDRHTGAGIELVPYVPLTLDTLPELAQLMADAFQKVA